MIKKQVIDYAKNTSITDFLFFVALGLFYSALMLYSTGITIIPKYAASKILCVVVLLILIARTFLLPRLNPKNIALYIPMAWLSFVTDIQSGEYILMTTLFAVLFASSDYALNRLLKFSLITILVLIGSVFLLTLIGVIPFVFHYRSGSTIIRYNLGFKYTTFLAHFLLTVYLLIGYLYSERLKNSHFIFGGIIAVIVFRLTDTKVVFVQSLLFLLVMWYYCHQQKKDQPIRLSISKKYLNEKIGIYFPIWATIMFIALALLRVSGEYPLIKTLDNLFTGRLRHTGQAFLDYPVTVFGFDMPFVTEFIDGDRVTNYFFIDSSFIHTLFTRGVVFFTIVIVFCVYMLNKAYETNKKMFIVLMFVMFHSLFDTQLMELHFTPFWFFLFSKQNVTQRGNNDAK